MYSPKVCFVDKLLFLIIRFLSEKWLSKTREGGEEEEFK